MNKCVFNFGYEKKLSVGWGAFGLFNDSILSHTGWISLLTFFFYPAFFVISFFSTFLILFTTNFPCLICNYIT